MKHRLTFLNFLFHRTRRNGEWSRDGFNLTPKACQLISQARHTIMQGPRDLKRRGQSNREGARNRRWRAYEATLVRVVAVEWPSMRVGSILVPASQV